MSTSVVYETAPISPFPQPEESEVCVEQLNERDNNLEPRNTREGRQGLDKADSEDKPSISEDYQKNKGTRTENTEKIKHKKPIWSNLRRVIGISFLSTIIVTFAIRSPGMLRSLELAAYDLLMNWRRYKSLSDPIVVVGITDAELKKWEETEIPDLILKALLEKLQGYEPRVIGLDIYRDKPQRIKPKKIPEYIQVPKICRQEPPGTNHQCKNYIENYNELINEIKNSDSTIIACVADNNIAAKGTKPPPGINDEQLGFSDFVYDDFDGDKIVRRSLLAMSLEGNPPCYTKYSLSYKLAEKYLKQEKIEPKWDEKGYLKWNNVDFIPLNEYGASGGYPKIDPGWGYDPQGYEILLDYRPGIKHYTYTELIKNKIPKENIQDRVVIIGYTSKTRANAHDLHATPYGKMPGVSIHAQMVSQIISAAKKERRLIWFWEPDCELLWTWFWSFIFGLLFLFFKKPLQRVLIVIVTPTLILIICWCVFSWLSGWIPLIPPLVTFFFVGVGIVTIDYWNKK